MKRGRPITAGILLVLLFFASVGASYAWFSGLSTLRPDLSFSAGAPDEYTVYKMTCPTPDADFDITETDTVGTEGFSADDLSFGKIMNLSMLDRTNYVYYAIRIPKADGGRASLTVSFGGTAGEHFKIFVPRRDAGGDIITEDEVISTEQLVDTELLTKIAAIETDNEATFLRYRAKVSALTPEELRDPADMDALFADGAELDMEGVGEELTIDVSTVDGEYYYLYLKLLPNIELYKYFVDYLWNHMPFFLAYDVRVGLTVLP